VQIVCKKCGPTRIGFKINEDAKTRVAEAHAKAEGGKLGDDIKKLKKEIKTRICRKCGEAL
jgi:hypothetical protein